MHVVDVVGEVGRVEAAGDAVEVLGVRREPGAIAVAEAEDAPRLRVERERAERRVERKFFKGFGGVVAHEQRAFAAAAKSACGERDRGSEARGEVVEIGAL